MTAFSLVRQLIRKNPFQFQLMEVVVNDSVTREAISRAQERKFLQFVKEDPHFCRYYEGIYILFKTGLRISEFCDLTISDIDFKEHTINIDHQLQKKSKIGYYIQETKTTSGTRKIPMTADVEECFRKIIEKRNPPKAEPMVDGKSRPTILQKPIVVRLYQEFLDGKTTDYIKRIFEKEGVRNWDGGTKWQATTLTSMLENEKYKGDTLLQKSYTVDFLTKKRTQNKGEIQMFYVEDDHDAIISKRIWECVQLEIKRRKKYLEEHGTNSYSHRPESNPFASKIICGDCNKVFARKGWRSSTGVDRKVWQCSERYKVKGVMGCANRHVEEETLIKAYLMAWNALVENREDFMEQWTEQLQSENLLESYRAEKFIEYTDGAKPLTEMDTDFMLKTLDHIKVFEDGTLLVVFLDGTEIECKNEEE